MQAVAITSGASWLWQKSDQKQLMGICDMLGLNAATLQRGHSPGQAAMEPESLQ